MDKLSDADKSRARYHMGYMGTSSAGSLQLGLAHPMQTLFVLEDALGLLVEDGAVARVRCILDTMDNIENQLRGSTTSLLAAQLGNLKLHPLAAQGKLYSDSLDREYRRWGERLADSLGAPPYWYSTRFRRRGPGTNVPVRS